LRLIVLFFALVWLWLAVFSHRVGGGYDAARIFSYLIVVNLLFDVVVQNQQERIADDIVEGRVNSYLTRPVSYFFALAASSFAMRFLVLCAIPFLWIFYRLFFHEYPLVFSASMLPVFFCRCVFECLYRHTLRLFKWLQRVLVSSCIRATLALCCRLALFYWRASPADLAPEGSANDSFFDTVSRNDFPACKSACWYKSVQCSRDAWHAIVLGRHVVRCGIPCVASWNQTI
jgi:hypothetical protein